MVERGPEKAGVGGPIPSLGMFIKRAIFVLLFFILSNFKRTPKKGLLRGKDCFPLRSIFSAAKEGVTGVRVFYV